MPITDYGKTVIYKIVCNDLTIKQCYVGHTTDMTKRKYAHKSCCHNEKDKDHNHKIYKIIREKGGWSNWSMLLVEKFPCKDKHEACKRERELYEELDAKMNMVRPYRTKEEIEQYDKQYREKNKEKIEQYYQDHKEKIKENNKQHYQDHKQDKKQYYQDHKQDKKQYYQDHKQDHKQYREKNKEKIKQYQKKYNEQYYQEKKEKIEQYQKKYNEQYREKIAEKNKEKIECEFCKKILSKCSMYRHIKTCKSKE